MNTPRPADRSSDPIETGCAAPLVTVVMPAFNPGRYLNSALDSALAQTGVGSRIILVDDGSDPPIRLDPPRPGAPIEIVRQPNAGQAAARNLGLALAGTEFVAFLDADDVWHPSKLHRQIEVLTANPHLAGVGCRAVLIDATDDFIGFGATGVSETASYTELSPALFLDAAAEAVLVPSMFTARRTAIWPMTRFETSFQPIEDLVFFDELLDNENRLAILESPLLARRVHGASLTSQHRAMQRAYRRWATRRVRPRDGDRTADRLLANTALVTGLSALAAGATPDARQLLRRAWLGTGRMKALAAFLFACLPTSITHTARALQHHRAGRRAREAWNRLAT